MVLLLFFIELVVFKQEVLFAQKQGKTIALDNFISQYLEHSFTLKSNYEKLRQARGNKLATESIDDINLNGTLGYGRANKITTVAGDVNVDQFSGTVGVTKNFSITGTSVSITDHFGIGTITGGKSASGNQFIIQVMQPVLRNFFGYLSRLSIKQSALALQAAELQYRQALEMEVMNAINLYLNWIEAYQDKSILQDIIKDCQIIFQQTRAQLMAGIAEISDLELSRIPVIQYQQRLLSNKSSYQSILLELNDYLSVSDLDRPDLTVVDKPLNIPNIATNPNYIKSIRALNYLLEKAQLGIDAARNQYFPSLDLVAQAQINSGESAYVSTANTSVGKSNFFLGAQVSMPLFFMQARANEIMSIAAYESILLQRDQAIRDILREVANVKTQLGITSESLNQQETLKQALRRQVVSQTSQYKRGSLQLENLINGRTSLSNSRLNENKLRIQAYQIYHQYLEIIGKLADEYKEAIPDNLIIK